MDEAQIFEKLNGMDSKLDKLLQWKAAHQESHKLIDRDIVEVRNTLFENPDGLKLQVQTLMNSRYDTFHWRDFWMDALKIVVAAVIITVLGWFLFLYKKGGSNQTGLFQHQPETKILNQNKGELK